MRCLLQILARRRGPASLPSATARLRAAFTLVELLVVIGIIAVLSGILLTVTTSGTESARAAKCLSNLRSLAQAANTAAMDSGIYPRAGSIQSVGLDASSNSMAYEEHPGWISWLSNNGDPFGHETGSAKPSSPVNVDLALYDEADIANRRFALTNGVIWKATGRNADIYCCPTLLKEHRKLLFTYVMNAKFGYDYSQGSAGVRSYIEYGTLTRADRVLMFAELTLGKSDKYARDCTLQYKATVNGNEYGKNWSGAPESIAFVHKSNKGRKCAHVAFADGHTEKFLAPTGSKGLKEEELTALLCAGKDIAFDGSSYSEIKETD